MTKIKVINIVRETSAGQDYKGVEEVDLDVNEGEHTPNYNEGELYPTSADNVGTPDDFPVRINSTHEDIASVLSRLTAADGPYKVVGQAANGGGTNEVFDVAQAAWQQVSVQFDRSSAQAQFQGVGYSSDGLTHPFSRSSSADAAAPTGDKTKCVGIAGLTYDLADMPGIIGGNFTIRRGQFDPDFGDNLNKLYPTGYDLLGGEATQYPVIGSLRFEDSQAVDRLGGDAADIVATLLAAGAATNPAITLQNAVFRGSRSQIRRRVAAGFPIDFFCLANAASPNTLPVIVS